MSNYLELNKSQIKKIQRNSEPYLFLDYATKIIPGQIAEGYLDLNEKLWFFEVHWPEDPNMPGMLQVEALVQLSALTILTKPGNEGLLIYLLNAEKLVFKKKVTPNNRLVMKTKLLSYKRGIGICSGKSYIKDELVCSANFKILFPGDFPKIS